MSAALESADHSIVGEDGTVGIARPVCPYGHGTRWVFLRYHKEFVCGKCGVRIVAIPGRTVHSTGES